MELKIKKLDPRAVVPEYATAGAACFDLVALPGEPFELHPGDMLACIFRTGLAFEVPPGWVMSIYSRSGHGFAKAIRLSNCVGQIDSDYRGEVKVALRCDGDVRGHINGGDRIAQARLERADQVQFVVVEELTDTARGSGGFGSTGS